MSEPSNHSPAKRPVLDTHQKALQINLDPTQYGSFAEIGAGQEVARWFFRVGGAAGTIAKTMSAYDMAVSDDIYGPVRRYVSRQRLQAMLEHEYNLMVQRLQARRGSTTRFFAFADTVSARSFQRDNDGHGWMGIRFQGHPQGPPNDVIIHVHLLDRENVQQQEALGIMGVNLIHAALQFPVQAGPLVESLLDNLTPERVEVDMIKCSGPDFAGVDNRVLSLQLVQAGLAGAAMFSPDGEVLQPAELLHKRPILVARGTFRPVTRLTLDMVRSALLALAVEPAMKAEDAVVLMEMSLRRLQDGGEICYKDFLDRVDTLRTVDKMVLVSNFTHHYELAAFFQRYTKQMVGMVMGGSALMDVFEESHYADLEGGILESFGRLFKNALRLYVYPVRDPETGALHSADNLQVAAHLRHLYAYLLENRCIVSLTDVDPACQSLRPQHALARLQSGDPAWEAMVPPQVAQMIKERRLFNYPGA